MSTDVQISKFMSLVLRHAPEQAGLVLDENGWTDFDALCEVLKSRFQVSAADVERVVAENPKKRFTLSGGRIRAAQGHSVDVDLALTPATPPAVLFHGTKAEFLGAILAEGLKSQSRQHVHLSKDVETAHIVARRRSGPDAILKIDAQRMAGEGVLFYQSENGVWLTDHVAPHYLNHVSEQEPT